MKSPTRRAALAVGVAILLVTAGCLGWTAPSDSTTTTPTTTTTTPTDTTTTSPSAGPENCTYDATATRTAETGTWSPDASVAQYPPGVADNGSLVNASTLVDAHFDETANTSMALRFESSLNDQVRTLVHGPDRTPFYSTFTEEFEDGRVRTEFYGAAPDGFARVSLPNETLHVGYQNATIAGIGAWTEYDALGGPEGHLYALLEGGNYSVNGTVERGDRTFVRLTTSEDSLETGHITNGTALVTPDGVVYDVNATAVQMKNSDSERRLDSSMSLDTDVEWCGAPSWVGGVPQLSLSIVEDGRAVEIRNTGGAALPANTSFDVVGKAEPVQKPRLPRPSNQSGTVTTETRLEPGEAVYLTADGDGAGASFALHDDSTRGEYEFGAAAVRGGNETVNYRLLTGVEPPEWAE